MIAEPVQQEGSSMTRKKSAIYGTLLKSNQEKLSTQNGNLSKLDCDFHSFIFILLDSSQFCSDDCDMFTQCFLDDARMNSSVICVAEQKGNTAPPCYGDGSKLTCSCNTSENYQLSSPDDTYLCNPDKWEDGLYDLYCFRNELTTELSTTTIDTTTTPTNELTTEISTTTIDTTTTLTTESTTEFSTASIPTPMKTFNLTIAVSLIIAIVTFLFVVLFIWLVKNYCL
ncbi:uncharacterized protein [Apostichopus japonicus]|uniref:uncharacterized protein isoform X2 n=1 Tax=Stichopus japonicus TaxID=307972 RepID=UPI003AB303F6